MEMKCGCLSCAASRLNFATTCTVWSGTHFGTSCFVRPGCYWPSSMALRLAMLCEVCRWMQVDIFLNRLGRIFACARNGDFGLIHDFGGRFGARGASDARRPLGTTENDSR